MNRYRSYGELDDQPKTVGDGSFIGVDEYNAGENIQPGNVQKAVNHDFTSQDANTRGGFVCLPELGAQAFGQAWTYNAIGASTANYNSIAYGNNTFVAIGATPVIQTTTDGITWTAGGATNMNHGNAIGFGNGVFIAGAFFLGGGLPCLARSTTGATWTNPTIDVPLGVEAVAYGNGLWVAAGSNGSLVSPQYATSVSSDNGLTWTTTIHTSFGSGEFRNLFFANGSFLAADLTSIWRSTDGVTWTQIYTSSALVTSFAFGNQKFVALTQTGEIYLSDNATSWTKVRNSDGDTWSHIMYGDGVFAAFAVSSGGDNVISSIDAKTWLRSTGVPNYAWRSAVYGNGLYLAIGDSGASMSSESVNIAIYGSGLYSDPNNIGETWIMLLAYNKVGFYASGRTGKSVSLGSYTVTEQSTIVQANNYVYIFRGPDETPLYWDGNWNGTFALVPDTNLPDSFESIPNSNQATYYQNRLWVVKGKDGLAASDVLEFTDYDPLANEFNLNTGNSDYIVATYPFGQNSLVAFKNKSILLLQNVEGSLSDVTVTEITRQVGVVGINGVTSIGPDLAYVSNRNINLLTLTSTNNALQHKILPLSTRIRKIMDRVNWEVGYKISLGYWNNKLYVALPLDNSLVCNAVVVYNFTTENWYGEWAFSDTLNMCIQGWQVVNYLGLQRMHAITEDGRIFVTDEGQNDISGTTVAEISTQLVTRAYDTDNLNHFQRRIYLDVATNRPKFSAAAFTEGASEESTLLTDQTYSRSETWKFADSAYDLTNANNDYNRAYRKDYSVGTLPNLGQTPGLPSDGLQCGTGFEPEMVQEFRLPLITRRQGRLSWIEVTNTQGFISVMSLGYETRAGQRANLVQV
jgi:hypothetical protein